MASLNWIFQHHAWANRRIVEACLGLTAEQLAARLPGAFGTIHQTLAHLLDGEYFFLYCLDKRYPMPVSEEIAGLSLPEIGVGLQQTGAWLIEIAPTLQPDALVEALTDNGPQQVPAALLLTQALVHAAEHREQVCATLTHLGIKAPDLNAWAYYFNERQ